MSKELFDSRSPLLLIPLPPRRAASPSPKLCEVLLDESFNDLGSVKVNRWDPTDSGRPRRCSKCACWWAHKSAHAPRPRLTLAICGSQWLWNCNECAACFGTRRAVAGTPMPMPFKSRFHPDCSGTLEEREKGRWGEKALTRGDSLLYPSSFLPLCPSSGQAGEISRNDVHPFTGAAAAVAPPALCVAVRASSSSWYPSGRAAAREIRPSYTLQSVLPSDHRRRRRRRRRARRRESE